MATKEVTKTAAKTWGDKLNDKLQAAETERAESRIVIKARELKWEDDKMVRSALMVSEMTGFRLKTLHSWVGEILPSGKTGKHRHTSEAIMLVRLLPRLAEAGVRTVPSSLLLRILPDAVVVRDRLTRVERTLDGVESVVLVTGNKASDALYLELKGRCDELHRIGDCQAPGLADRAVYDGHRIGRAI